ncbi:hypothetical protein KP509_26G052500 [Ceratopteris richardii]|uniref:Uncharacterized protein n=1 Tax=Ceratopteris richardii TaxID=49495 RepID=A0A8T2RMR7_CERRI|nr:hypothetical protein KP509_26G052500 [Ceratopteris richardii]
MSLSSKGYCSIYNVFCSIVVLMKKGRCLKKSKSSQHLLMKKFRTVQVAISTLTKYEREKGSLVYNAHNNIFVDLKFLQYRVVQLYNISIMDCPTNLKYLIKRDYCEVLSTKSGSKNFYLNE